MLRPYGVTTGDGDRGLNGYTETSSEFEKKCPVGHFFSNSEYRRRTE
jgi:hypothetical protein